MPLNTVSGNEIRVQALLNAYAKEVRNRVPHWAFPEKWKARDHALRGVSNIDKVEANTEDYVRVQFLSMPETFCRTAFRGLVYPPFPTVCSDRGAARFRLFYGMQSYALPPEKSACRPFEESVLDGAKEAKIFVNRIKEKNCPRAHTRVRLAVMSGEISFPCFCALTLWYPGLEKQAAVWDAVQRGEDLRLALVIPGHTIHKAVTKYREALRELEIAEKQFFEFVGSFSSDSVS